MKISLEWLREYIELDLEARQIAQKLSDLGFPVESVETVGEDTVLDVEVTSNRGDCLSHIGIARELAAAYGLPLKRPRVQVEESDRPAEEHIRVRIDAPDLCGRYTARVITGVKVGPSPAWMVRRLEAVGLRSVNNVVDATNYAMMEHGQPPHAFDYDKIGDRQIIVRRAREGETIVSIDGSHCNLKSSMLVIADAQIPVAVAGVMGGLDTEVTDATTTILLEEASFDPVCTRTTARTLGLNSEASFRFERQVDMPGIEWNSLRCAQLIIQVAGGRLARGIVDAYPGKTGPTEVRMRLSRLNHLLGIEIPQEKVMAAFAGLGFEPRLEGGVIVCKTPSWRHDITREVDLIEEAGRMFGYDKIPVEPKIYIKVAPVDRCEQTAERIRTFLNGAGFFETINVTFTDNRTAEWFDEGPLEDHLAVGDVSRKNANLLRRQLLGSLLLVMQSNSNAGNAVRGLYELADTFLPTGAGMLPDERRKLGLMINDDFQSLRGVIEGLVDVLAKDVPVVFRPASLKWAQAGATIWIGEHEIGVAGVLKPEIAMQADLEKQTIAAAELDFQTLADLAGNVPVFRPLPRFPAITRDLSLVLDEPITWARVEETIRSRAPQILEQIGFTALYRGKPIPAGKKSLTVSLRFRDEEGTLRHEQVDAFEVGIMEGLKEKLGAELRAV